MSELKVYTADEVKEHNKKDDCWVIVKGKVYDVTNFDKHPGGIGILRDHGGADATVEFDTEGHSATAKKQMAEFLIGKLDHVVEEDEDMEEVIDTNSGAKMRIAKKVIYLNYKLTFVPNLCVI